jgi:hypothetical protein
MVVHSELTRHCYDLIRLLNQLFDTEIVALRVEMVSANKPYGASVLQPIRCTI